MSLNSSSRGGGGGSFAAVAFVGFMLFASEGQAGEKFFPARANGVPKSYGVTLLRPVASSTPEILIGAVGGRLGYVYRRVLNGFEAELSEWQAERLARHPLVKNVVQETYLEDPVSYTLPHCYEDFDTNTRALPPLPGPGNPVPQQALSCADPAPGGDCIDNWGIDRIDQVGLPRDEEFSYRQSSGNVKVFVVDRGVAASNREFEDAAAVSRVEEGVDTNDCTNFPSDCPPGNVPCEHLTSTATGHGTHVGGILGGRTFGLARDVEIVPVKALCPGYSTGHFKRALEWILLNHPPSSPTAVVNLSGMNAFCYADPSCTDGTQLREAVVNLASRDNLLLVQSAGNQSFLALPDPPGGYNGLISACDYTFGDEARYSDPADAAAISRILVAAGSDENDGLWRTDSEDEYGHPIGSNVGACVDVFSPAAHIVSAYSPRDPGSSDPDEVVCQLSGTSMSAPHVSGVAAMILQNSPTMTSTALRTMILNWAERGALETNPGDPNYIGAGSPNLLLHWDPSAISRDGFETGDLRLWSVSP